MDQLLLQQYLDKLAEGKRTSVTRITRQTKIKRATGQLAVQAAKEHKDPLYDRMVKYRELFYKYREMIHKKYSPRVRSKARR